MATIPTTLKVELKITKALEKDLRAAIRESLEESLLDSIPADVDENIITDKNLKAFVPNLAELLDKQYAGALKYLTKELADSVEMFVDDSLDSWNFLEHISESPITGQITRKFMANPEYKTAIKESEDTDLKRLQAMAENMGYSLVVAK